MAILLAQLLLGCVQFRRGLYDASELTGAWYCRQAEGVTTFRYPSSKKPKWFISEFSAEKGKLYFSLGSFGRDQAAFYRSVRFLGDTIHIVSHDMGELEAIGTNVDFTSYYSQTIRAGDSEDITVTLPPFAVDGVDIPALSARFKWSDRKYYQFVPIQ